MAAKHFLAIIPVSIISDPKNPGNSNFIFTVNQLFYNPDFKGDTKSADIKDGDYYELVFNNNVDIRFRYRIKLKGGQNYPLGVNAENEKILLKIHGLAEKTFWQKYYKIIIASLVAIACAIIGVIISNR